MEFIAFFVVLVVVGMFFALRVPTGRSGAAPGHETPVPDRTVQERPAGRD